MNLQLRIIEAWRASGLSILAVAKRAELPYAGVYGLLRGQSDARLSTGSKVADALGLRLVADRRRTAKAKG